MKLDLTKRKKSLFIGGAIILKVLLLYMITSFENNNSYYEGFWGKESGDTSSYLDPIDSFLITGEYEPHYRMPGYGFWYGLILLFFPKSLALNLLIIFQSVCSGISVYCLASLGYKLTNSKNVFLSVYFIFLFTTYSSWYDHYLMTESLSVSFLIILIYYFVRFFSTNSNINIFLSGLLFANLVFLRPVFLPIGGIIFILILCQYGDSLNRVIKLNLFYFIPFLILDSVWIYSGYQKFNKIIPLQESFFGPNIDEVFYEPPFRFIQSWGGNYLWWDSGAEIRFFAVGTDSLEYYDKGSIEFPKAIFTSKFNIDSLELASDRLMELKINRYNFSDEEFNQKSDLIYQSFESFSTSIKNEDPILYHIKSRISLIRLFFIGTKTTNPLYRLKIPFRDYLIILKSIGYIITLFLGYFAGIVLLFYIRENPLYLLVSGIIWYTFLIHPIILRLVENRYLMPSYAFLNLAIILAIFELNKTLRLAKK